MIHIIQPDIIINLSLHTPNYNPKSPRPLQSSARWTVDRIYGPGDRIGVNVIHINTLK